MSDWGDKRYSRKDALKGYTMSFAQRHIQEMAAIEKMQQLHKIAEECGAIFGEGALNDSISFGTREQEELFQKRVSEEWLK